jgi:hypothetical protein
MRRAKYFQNIACKRGSVKTITTGIAIFCKKASEGYQL